MNFEDTDNLGFTWEDFFNELNEEKEIDKKSENEIKEMIKEILINKDTLKLSLINLKKYFVDIENNILNPNRKIRNDIEKEIDALEDEHNQNEVETVSLIGDYSNGLMTKEELNEKLKKIKEREIYIKSKLNEIRRAKEETDKIIENTNAPKVLCAITKIEMLFELPKELSKKDYKELYEINQHFLTRFNMTLKDYYESLLVFSKKYEDINFQEELKKIVMVYLWRTF